jgi:hypothetical protein
VAAEGDLTPDPATPLELTTPGDPIVLPDGKRIYPPCLHGHPIDALALALLDMHEPAESTFLRPYSMPPFASSPSAACGPSPPPPWASSPGTRAASSTISSAVATD